MNVVYKGLTKLKNMYNQINPATLTGAIDIIVVEQPDGSLLASPFHVRFGKLGVLQTRERVVNISINGDPVQDLQMKLGDQGEAFFVIDIDDADIPSRLITSPLPSRPSTPKKEEDSEGSGEEIGNNNDESCSSKRKRRKKRKRKSQNMSDVNHLVVDWSNTAQFRDDTNLQSTTANTRTSSQSSTDSFMMARTECYCDVDAAIDNYYDVFSLRRSRDDAETNDGDGGDDSNIPEVGYRRVQSDSELPDKDHSGPFCEEQEENSKHQRKVMWGWGQLPDENVRDSSGDERLTQEDLSVKDEDVCGDDVCETDDVAATSSVVVPPQFDSQTHFRSLSASELSDPNDESSIQLSTDESNKPRDTESAQQQQVPCSSAKAATTTADKQQTAGQQRQRNASEGLYLDDVLSLHPAQADLYLKVKTNAEGTASVISIDNNERAASPSGGSDVDSGTDCHHQEEVCSEADAHVGESSTDITASLCGFPTTSSSSSSTTDPTAATATPEAGAFEEKMISYEAFLLNPMSYINDPNLVFRINERYYNYTNAQAMIFSLAVFKQPLPQECMESSTSSEETQATNNNTSSVEPTAPQQQQPQQSSRIMNWLWRRRDKDLNKSVSESDSITDSTTERQDTPPAPKSEEEEIAVIMDPTDLSGSQLEESVVAAITEATGSEPLSTAAVCKNMRKTTRLTSEELERLDLKEGANTITFSVTTQYQGTKRCCAHIHKWKWHDKIVVSDIDGTITKSDVFGQILPVVGKDWTQSGIANLYHNISKNGYKFIYLSARAIGQASMTKDYLLWINQHGITLPPGPLLLSPTSLISAFRREVIEKRPEKFKIECLQDIKALFPIGNPFYAGFGNKVTDVKSYAAVEIPDDRMFTINHRGELKQEQLPTYTTTLSDLGDVVDNFFPFITDDRRVKDVKEPVGSMKFEQNYSDFSYWRCDLPALTEDDMKLLSKSN